MIQSHGGRRRAAWTRSTVTDAARSSSGSPTRIISRGSGEVENVTLPVGAKPAPEYWEVQPLGSPANVGPNSFSPEGIAIRSKGMIRRFSEHETDFYIVISGKRSIASD